MKKSIYRPLLILETVFIILLGISCYAYAHDTRSVGHVAIATDKNIYGNILCVTVERIDFMIVDGKPVSKTDKQYIKKEIVPELTASDVNDNRYTREWFSEIKEGDYYVGEE